MVKDINDNKRKIKGDNGMKQKQLWNISEDKKLSITFSAKYSFKLNDVKNVIELHVNNIEE